MMVGCNRKIVYCHYEHTPVAGWDKSDTLVFNVDSVPRGGVYSEKIGLRMYNTYPFKMLAVVVEQRAVPSGASRQDTLHMELVAENGDVLGRGINLLQYTFPLGEISLKQGDSLRIRVFHHMRRQLLRGIADVGVSVQ